MDALHGGLKEGGRGGGREGGRAGENESFVRIHKTESHPIFPPSLPPSLPYLRAERRHIRPDEPVGVTSDGLGVHVLVELHVAGVDAENLQAPGERGREGGREGGKVNI